MYKLILAALAEFWLRLRRLNQVINPIARWNIHSTNYERKEAVRRWLFNSPLFSRLMRYGKYGEGVGGWDGWWDIPFFGVVAFVGAENGETLAPDYRRSGDVRFKW